MSRWGSLAVGLLVAAAGQFVALGMAGGGHGWSAPVWCSVLLWFVCPVVATHGGMRGRSGPSAVDRGAAALLCISVLADGMLLAFGDNEYLPATFDATPTAVVIWIVLWIGAQSALAAIVLTAAWHRL